MDPVKAYLLLNLTRYVKACSKVVISSIIFSTAIVIEAMMFGPLRILPNMDNILYREVACSTEYAFPELALFISVL